MKRYYFDLVGDMAANDFIGREFATPEEATRHAQFLARHTATEMPELVRRGNHILMRDEHGFEIYRALITSTAPAA